MTEDHAKSYRGPATLTLTDGRELTVHAELVTTTEPAMDEWRSGFREVAVTVRTWGGTLFGDHVLSVDGAAVITLPDGRDGTLYCGGARAGSDIPTQVDVVGAGPAPY